MNGDQSREIVCGYWGSTWLRVKLDCNTMAEHHNSNILNGSCHQNLKMLLN